MINIAQFEKRPASLLDYYKLAVTNPRQLCQSINFDEEVANSGLTILVIGGLQSILAGFLGVTGFSSKTGILLSFVGLFFGLGLGSLIVFVIAKVANAKMNLLRSFNLVIHSWLLTLPFSLMTQIYWGFGIFTTILNLAFMVFVMIKIFEANALKVSIFTGFLFLILFVPFACFKLTQTVVDSHPQMQDLLQGKTLEQYRNEIDKQADEIDSQNQEDIEEELAEAMQNLEDGNEEVQKAMQQLAQMQRDMKLGEKILPPCYHQLIDKNDDKNPVFVLIGTQVSLLGMSPKEERQQGIQSLHQQIDQYSGAAEGPMAISEAEKQCLQEIKANLSKIN